MRAKILTKKTKLGPTTVSFKSAGGGDLLLQRHPCQMLFQYPFNWHAGISIWDHRHSIIILGLYHFKMGSKYLALLIDDVN